MTTDCRPVERSSKTSVDAVNGGSCLEKKVDDVHMVCASSPAVIVYGTVSRYGTISRDGTDHGRERYHSTVSQEYMVLSGVALRKGVRLRYHDAVSRHNVIMLRYHGTTVSRYNGITVGWPV